MTTELFNAQFKDSFVTGVKSSKPNAPEATAQFFSLPKLESAGIGKVSRLPVSIRIVLESLLRNLDGQRIEEHHVRALANWQPNGTREQEIPFVVARVLLQDFTGVPLGVDLAAMRSAVAQLKRDPSIIEPLVPVDLVIDHSVQVDFSSQVSAFKKNLDLEFDRNLQRYQFLKWCMNTFESFSVVPPGIGICHQVNLEYLAKGVLSQTAKRGGSEDSVYFPDTLVGTDSHTTMINGLGVVGWGVGGIEAESAMLGQPVYFLTPDVVGVNLTGKLKEGVTATDLVLSITELLRKTKVVGKFVEFHGPGAASLSVTDRATISNMAPEYGATIGFFPVDEKSCDYLRATGRSEELITTFRNYYKAQGLFGIPDTGACDYSQVVSLDLGTIEPCIAGPKRPQDRIELRTAADKITGLLDASVADGGYGKSSEEKDKRFPVEGRSPAMALRHGDVLIAAITSCTNTSNPSVMLAAGLLAKKAVEKGLTRPSYVKASLAPGSRAVSDYLEKTGLQKYLDEIGFNLVGYGCTTCIGNSGPLDRDIEETVQRNDLIGAAVLSGNRNFEARVHQSIKANFLMSPPLVVAYALAGNVLIDLASEPLGKDRAGNAVYLKDIWPTSEEIGQLLNSAFDASMYKKLYSGFTQEGDLWSQVKTSTGVTYEWDRASSYIQEPPYFDDFSVTLDSEKASGFKMSSARALAIFGDSVTTDHISPAGSIKASSPAGKYLQAQGVAPVDFNSYGARRGNHEVMVRGTFANVRIKNLMVPGTEGGVTIHQPSGEQLSIYDASERYIQSNVPLIVIAGQEYGTGSSRDWAAKGTRLLGVKAVIAQSFERIHRSNLVGMGVLPCQFAEGTSAQSLNLKGDESYAIVGLENGITPRQQVTLKIDRADGSSVSVPLTLRIDTPIEVAYFNHGGILPYVLRQLLNS